VLSESDLCLLKVAAAEYDSVTAVPKNTGGSPQRYFKWINMPSTTVLDLWHELYIYDLQSIANSTSSGPGASEYEQSLLSFLQSADGADIAAGTSALERVDSANTVLAASISSRSGTQLPNTASRSSVPSSPCCG
jgi:hypothetical protein